MQLQLRTKVNLQKTSDCWNSYNYRTVSCRYY